jgi:lactoylglutathione lyase
LFVGGFLFSAAADEPRRPRIVGISHVALYVHDIELSRAFYKGYLGFDEPFTLNDADGKLHLTWIKVNDHQTIELFPEKKPGADRLNHISLETDDAEAMRLYLGSGGVKVPAAVPKGKIGNSNFNITDPDGHTVEIVQYQPDGWTMREKGKFLPETRISTHLGHVGITVGNLDASMKFYRDLLGFSETWRGGRDDREVNWVLLKVPDGDDYVEFMLLDKAPELEAMHRYHHLGFDVPDVPKARAILRDRRLPKEAKPPTPFFVARNNKRLMNAADPDGTRVEFMEATFANGVPPASSTAPLPAYQIQPHPQ